MDFDVKLQGFKELAEQLRELPGNLGKNTLRRAVSSGAAVVRVEAKNNALAMKKSGTLARAIYQKQIRELSGPQKQTFFVGARSGKQYKKVGKKGLSKDAYYARWVELGHFTREPGKAGTLKKYTERGALLNEDFATAVRTGHIHWVPAHPFLRPAFDVKKDAAVTAISADIALSLASEAERIKIATGK